MFSLDNITNKNNKEHNEKWLYIPDHLYRILIIDGSGSEKTNAFLNLIKEQNSVIDKMYLHAKDLSEPNYEFLIKKCRGAGIKHLNDPNAFIECSNTMDDVCENINDCNPNRKKTLILFDNKIAYIVSNKKNSSCCKRIVF